MTSQRTIDDFHRAYYDEQECMKRLSFMGIPILKYPTDLFIYSELMYRVRPDVIIETGTHRGGSALFLATMFDALRISSLHSEQVSDGQVITVDVQSPDPKPCHSRIQWLQGSSTSSAVLADIVFALGLHEETPRVMVILDSDHSQHHVIAELHAYEKFVSVGSYLIVEDTNVNGHPVFSGHGPGPWEAVEEFLASGSGKNFVADHECEKLLLTANPKGFLRRVS